MSKAIKSITNPRTQQRMAAAIQAGRHEMWWSSLWGGDRKQAMIKGLLSAAETFLRSAR